MECLIRTRFFLLEKHGRTEPKHYTIDDLKAIKAKYVAMRKEMMNG